MQHLAFLMAKNEKRCVSMKWIEEKLPNEEVNYISKIAGFILEQKDDMLTFIHPLLAEYLNGRFLFNHLFESNSEELQKEAERFVFERKYNDAYWNTFFFLFQEFFKNHSFDAFQALKDVINGGLQDILGMQRTLLHLLILEAFVSVREGEQNDKFIKEFKTLEPASNAIVNIAKSESNATSNMIIHKLKSMRKLTWNHLLRFNNERDDAYHFFPKLTGLLTRPPTVSKQTVVTAVKCLDHPDVVPLLHYFKLSRLTFPQLVGNEFEGQNRFVRFLDVYMKHANRHIGEQAFRLSRRFWVFFLEETKESIVKWMFLQCENPDWTVRWNVFNVIVDAAKLCPDNNDIWSILEKGCADEYWNVRAHAVQHVVKVSKYCNDHSQAAWRLLCAACKDTDSDTRKAAVKQIASLVGMFSLEPTLAWEVLIEACADSDEKIRRLCVDQTLRLVEISPEQEMKANLCFDLLGDDSSPHVQSEVIRNALIYAEMFPKNEQDVWNRIKKCCFGGNEDVQRAALSIVSSFIKIFPRHATSAWKILSTLSETHNKALCTIAIEQFSIVLKILRTKIEEALNVLASKFKEKCIDTLSIAAKEIVKIVELFPKYGEKAWHHWMEACYETHGKVRFIFIDLIGSLAHACPDLWKQGWELTNKLLNDKDHLVRQRALQQIPIIGKISPEIRQSAWKIMSEIEDTDQNKFGEIALNQVSELANEKEEAKEVLEMIRHARETNVIEARKLAVHLSSKLLESPLSKEALHELLILLDDKENEIRMEAQNAINKVPLKEAIEFYWESDDSRIVKEFAEKLVKFEVVGYEPVPEENMCKIMISNIGVTFEWVQVRDRVLKLVHEIQTFLMNTNIEFRSILEGILV